MASTYSTNLKIELIGTGDQTGAWGTTTNVNLGTALEEAIIGYGAVQFTNDANLTISIASSNTSQTARKLFLYVTSTVTLSQQRDLIVPTIEKTYLVHNNTTGGQAIRVKTSAGTGVVVPIGKKMLLYVNGVNVIEQLDYVTNLEIGNLNVSTPLPVTSGGTGASTAGTARTNLGLGTIATQDANNVAITGGSISGITDLAIADGGTGASTANAALNNLLPSQAGNNGKYLKSNGTDSSWDALDISTADITGTLPVANGGTGATTAGTARTNLGLGTISTQNANSVAITGGTINGISDLAVADGGTGASDAGTARTNLGLGTISTQNSNSVSITGGSITGISDLAVADGGTGASDAATARTNLGLGTISTQAASNVSITGGSITGITDLAVTDGGTGSSTASGARTNLGLAIGTDIPSLTGTGASGTWGISISGNAGNVSGIVAVANGGTGASSASAAISNLGILQAVYPIGSIYINATNNANPGTLLGFGTWVAFGAGRVPVGFDATDPSFDTPEETGGSKDAVVVSHTHTFSATTNTTGAHTHTLTMTEGANNTGYPASGNEGASSTYTTSSAGAHSHTVSGTTASTGSSGTNANLQPYITVYMWKRTA